jgi:hypothetical protein
MLKCTIYAIGILFNCKYTLKTVAIWLDLCLCFIVGYGLGSQRQ